MSYRKKKEYLDSDPATRQIRRNMQNYYEAFFRMNHLTTIGTLDQEENSNPSSTEGEELFEDDSVFDLPMSVENQSEVELDPLFNSIYNRLSGTQSLSPIHPTETIEHHEAIAAKTLLPRSTDSKGFKLPARLRMEALLGDNGETQAASKGFDIQFALGTRVDLLEKIGKAIIFNQHESDHSTQPAMPEAIPVKDFPNVYDVSKRWGLNDEQQAAFLLCSFAILQRLHLNVKESSQSKVTAKQLNEQILKCFERFLPSYEDQLSLFIGGCGGTGKSQIVHALMDFCDRWKCSTSVVVCAFSGIAAMLIQGCTLHSALGISIEKDPKPPSEMMKIAWSEVDLIVIDECSMLAPSMLDLLDRRLRQLKSNPNLKFGGLHVTFVGDFYQLKPILEPLLGTACDSSDRRTATTSLATIRGQELWSTCLTDAVLLTQNYRQTDPRWKASQERWRENRPTIEDINDINSRYIDEGTENEETMGGPPTGTTVAVPDNKTREKILRFYEQRLLDGFCHPSTLERTQIGFKEESTLLQQT